MNSSRTACVDVALVLGALALGCGGSDPAPAHAARSASGGTGGGGNVAGSGNSSGMSTGGSDGSGATGGDTTVGTAGDTGNTTGGSAGTSGGAGGSDSKGGMGGTAGKRPVAMVVPCEDSGNLPDGAPKLEPGVWKNVTPEGIPLGDAENIIGQGLAMDPCNPAVLYWGTTPFDDSQGGIYKTVDGGGHWALVGDRDADLSVYDHESTFLDEPLHIRIDPNNHEHMYAGDGVRGGNTGFWVSWDSGQNWSKTAGWVATAKSQDVYDVAVDPTDFNHVLVAFHGSWAWGDPVWGNAAGILESLDGGDSWIQHDPQPSWEYGHAINFLYNPELGIGNSDTWLLGTQADGFWRTEDAGKTWKQVVSNATIFHGGGDIYYAKDGTLYASGTPQVLRSTDNGLTWGEVNGLPDLGYTGVFGDGTFLYTAPAYGYGDQPYFVSSEDDGLNWEPFDGGSQTFRDGGPFEMAFDKKNGILYSSNWFGGVWAMKVPY